MAGDEPLVSTRLAWQAVAEHVLSAALHAATGRIGLRAAADGFATPPHPAPDGSGPRRLVVAGTDLVVEGDGAEVGRAPLTTLRATAELVGVEPGAPTAVYTPSTPLDLDAPLPVDPAAAAELAAWYALVDDALAVLSREHEGEEPAPVQLWPEHFDLATTIGEVNVGGSPGDDEHPRPYLYVGPWAPPPVGGFWNEGFGASRDRDEVADVATALAFLREGLDRARTPGAG